MRRRCPALSLMGAVVNIPEDFPQELVEEFVKGVVVHFAASSPLKKPGHPGAPLASLISRLR